LKGDKKWSEEGFYVPMKKIKKENCVKGVILRSQDEGGAAHEANKQPWKDATTI
jgi:hypothetical protein